MKTEIIDFENVLKYAKEVTETQYFESFEVLPPILVNKLNNFKISGFVVAEPYNYNKINLPVFAMYFKMIEPLTKTVKYYILKEYVYLKYNENPVYWYENNHWTVTQAFTN